MRVLITGGEGFIGTATRRALQARDHEVVTLDSLDPVVHTGDEARDTDHRFIHADVRDDRAVRMAVRDTDAVLHLAAEGGLGRSMVDPRPFTDANVTGTAVLLAAIRDSPDVRKLVVASSVGVYGEGAYVCAVDGPARVAMRPASGDASSGFEIPCPTCGRPLQPIPTPETHPAYPTSVYSVTKLATEQLAVAWGMATGLVTVALRYFCTYGPGQSLTNPYTGLMTIFLARIAAGRPPLVFEDGLQTRDFVYVDDVAEANVLALGADAEPAGPLIVNVGTGRSTSVLEVARTVCEIAGASEPPLVTGRRRIGDVRHIVADPALAERTIGWRPATDLQSGLDRTQAWASGERSSDRLEQAIDELERRGLMA